MTIISSYVIVCGICGKTESECDSGMFVSTATPVIFIAEMKKKGWTPGRLFWKCPGCIAKEMEK